MYLTKVTSVPAGSRRRIWNSSMNDRIRKMPRPEVRIRFSGDQRVGKVGEIEPVAFVRDSHREPLPVAAPPRTAPSYSRYTGCRVPPRSPSIPARPSRSSSGRLRRNPPVEPRPPPAPRRYPRSPMWNPETVLQFPVSGARLPAYTERPECVAKANRQNKLPALQKSRSVPPAFPYLRTSPSLIVIPYTAARIHPASVTIAANLHLSWYGSHHGSPHSTSR